MTAALKRMLFSVIAGAAAAVLIVSLAGVPNARADHEPAMHAAAAGSALDKFDDETPLLTDTIRVSSPEDIIIAVTAECSIITELSTGGENPDFSEASGTVDLWVTLDGTPVPVATDDTQAGRVTFCNRTYGRGVTDTEGDGDVDEEDDYIRTRNANAFNWLALDTGVNYDSPANGNNIIEIILWGDFETSETGEAFADAFVGSRTLIATPTRVSVHEAVAPTTETTGSRPGKGK